MVIYMSQSDNKLMTIGEAAKSLGITRRIILNYEAKGLLPPDKKDGSTGNRYYTADSVSRIRSIRILQNLGLSLDDINAYYNGATDLEPLIERLETLRDEINLNIEKLKERIRNKSNFEIKSVTIPAQTVYRKTVRAASIAERTVQLREVFVDAMRQYGSDTSKRMFFMEYSIEDPDLVSYCIAVPPTSRGADVVTLPEEKALCVFHHGSYESIPAVRDKIIAHAFENNIRPKGICRHIYLEGPPQHKDPEKFITQVAVMIE